MIKLKKITIFLVFELLIVFSYIFILNNYIGNVDKHINADAIGYYDYLPSIFIYGDFVRNLKPISEDSKLYNRIDTLDSYITYCEHRKVNKYPCGTAILQSPFFICKKLSITGDKNIDPYSKSFQKTIFYSNIFYLFLSLIFFKGILLKFKIKKVIILMLQLTLVFSTSITHYSNFDAGFSHIYSLFAILGFIYFIKNYLDSNKNSHLIVSSLFLSLIFLIRPPNIIIILFIPFLSSSLSNLKISFQNLIKSPKTLTISLIIFILISSIQLVAWYLQTDIFFVYSYQGESFDFLKPEIYNILFSYKKGLFVYSPILLLFLIISIGVLFYKKSWYLLLSWIFFFSFLTYFLSSWWSWFYGCSYGLRAYLEFYPVFFILFAITFNNLNKWILTFLLFLAITSSYINVVQTYQYKEYIMHWIDMDKEKYWKIFLKTEEKYKGLIWKDSINNEDFIVLQKTQIADLSLPLKEESKTTFSIDSKSIPSYKDAEIIQIQLSNQFSSSSNIEIKLLILDSTNYPLFNQSKNIIHFHKTKLNNYHSGIFNYKVKNIKKDNNQTVSIEVSSKNTISDSIKNISVKFLKPK